MRLRISLYSITIFSAILCLPAAAATPASITRYVRFQHGDTVSYGIVEQERVRQLEGDLFGSWKPSSKTYSLKEVTLLVPSAPSKVLAMAGNYKEHMGSAPLPDHPELFFKLPSCLVPHLGDVMQPADHEPVHYEPELVIVMGKRARWIDKEEALDYVLGVTCGNDISARHWQKNDTQWWRAKGSDTFGPCGPFIVAGIDYNRLTMRVIVNGEIRQEFNTSNMIFDVAEIVSFASQHVTLEPGDLIYTGTAGKTEPLAIGDQVEIEIEHVGTLRNRVVAEPSKAQRKRISSAP
jgi:2-keto-4-pentenoate hydratase/2-oxohepta-3-ene-1,7-dioic acid hydratase in catechol pathway